MPQRSIMLNAIPVKRKSRVIHDFPYGVEQRRCPHAGIVNVTKTGHCVFDCAYCYAKSYPWSSHGPFVAVYENLPELLDSELRAIRICPPLYFCAVTDPFQPLDLVWETSLKAMSIAANHGAFFTIITKSDYVLKILKTTWADYERFHVSLTCESLSGEKLKAISRAPAVFRRLRAVEKLVSAGVSVSVRVDPIISGLTDDYCELDELLQTLGSIGVHHITASSGSFNSAGFRKLVTRIEETGYAEAAALMRSRYIFNGKKFTLNMKDRLKLYEDLTSLCGRYDLGLSLCQEPLNLTLGDAVRCRALGKLAVRDRSGHLVPICSSDCLNACPNRENPPCKNEKLRAEYPFKWATLT
ncbi:MAG TPA: radical SAM protein [Candidatus Bathyarchaeia archaeon]|nr:radical SAM protein [Candidatus Bathyarchaeia archaeon]